MGWGGSEWVEGGGYRVRLNGGFVAVARTSRMFFTLYIDLLFRGWGSSTGELGS